ncbi:unnamed protein product [Cylicocyclus nassatus]|uniref:Protein kinase domain-containing protein n=1 Tax=Cylicocyclus nassatus TaxID=53992 RepID=A0AA36DTI8_CYLNA|nr:unnamed protein product [Cylicocyclus nassatus]
MRVKGRPTKMYPQCLESDDGDECYDPAKEIFITDASQVGHITLKASRADRCRREAVKRRLTKQQHQFERIWLRCMRATKGADRSQKKPKRVWVDEDKQRGRPKRGRPRKSLVQAMTETEAPNLTQVQTKSRLVHRVRRYGVAVEPRHYERKTIHLPQEGGLGSQHVPGVTLGLSWDNGHMELEPTREEKRIARELKRRVKLEELERKREARRLKREMKEKLTRERRERRVTERQKREEERLASLRKEGETVRKTETNEEIKKLYVPDVDDESQSIHDMSFCYGTFPTGKIFNGKWLVLEEIFPNRHGVAAYYVVENDEHKIEGILYAQDMSNSFAHLPEEVYFLQTQSDNGRSYLFQTVIDCQLVSAPDHPDFFYCVFISRKSASLADLWNRYPKEHLFKKEGEANKAWSLGTVGRLAADILSIIEATYEAGYTFRSIDLSHFRLDLRTRRLFLENASEVVVSTELTDLRLRNGEHVCHNYWQGCLEYAPLSLHHKGRESIMRAADCAEVLFYIILDLLGLLTWRGLDESQTAKCKEEFMTQNRKKVPAPLYDYWKIVQNAQAIDASKLRRQDDYLLLDGVRGGATVSVLDFRKLAARLVTVYEVFGGVVDESAPYDFEVVDDPAEKTCEQQREDSLVQRKEFLKHKQDVLGAQDDAMTMREELGKRSEAQTERERAEAMQDANVSEQQDLKVSTSDDEHEYDD